MTNNTLLEASSDASFSSTADYADASTKRKGKLYYVIGPSGAGKDTLIDAIRADHPEDIIVAHRYITRPFGAGGENHVAVSEQEYLSRQQKGLFAMSWQAHGLCYGVGLEVKAWLDKGFSVLLNGSRAELAQAQQCFGSDLVPVVVNVELDVLRTRLQNRGRESREEIERRLQRATEFTLSKQEGFYPIDNSGDVQSSAKQFRHIRFQLEGKS
ncbi:ribose 1,5-bisphosphokinase [Vibrio mediterranei]|uniref:ribose 1,5-bisphosphokinase n=1 Tax=Vibrio mediterranei TaxID=689 RepID=UPI00148C571C|nr:ribose 1,5-bisphosphokinase [Vibrio mediterranei]NOI25040.1 ribose 1,5-bisphosphokinase [Vibrio mediterranei]